MPKLLTLHDFIAKGWIAPSVGADLDEGIGVSDARLKEDIAPVGQTAGGLPLYRFRYIGGEETYVGVMAQDVRDVVPEAVVEGEDGYLRVHYGRLGIDLKTRNQWRIAPDVGADLGDPPISTVRVKEDIARVGQTASGLPLYRFRYIGRAETYVGVLAEDVAEREPDAIVHGDDGYLRVDYGRLGLSLMTWDQWQARKTS